jgi:hypothetical protein
MQELLPKSGYSVYAEFPAAGDHWRSCPSCGARRYTVRRSTGNHIYTPHAYGCAIAQAVYMLRTYKYTRLKEIHGH